jgi:2-haloacid dehalogenase
MEGSFLSQTVPVFEGVIFDLGAVVIDWNPMHLYRKLFNGDEAKAADFLTRICTTQWNAKQDAGRDLEEAAAERIARYPGWEPEIRAFYGRWVEMIGGSVPGTAAVMGELKAAGQRLFALSNWNSITFASVRHRFGELALFEEIVLSGDYGCIKPDPELYHIALKRYGIAPGKLLFIDDSEANIEAGEALGIKGLLFENAEKLKSDLVWLGLLPARAPRPW